MIVQVEERNFKGETIPPDLEGIYQKMETLFFSKEGPKESTTIFLPMAECNGPAVLRERWKSKLNWHFNPDNRAENSRDKCDEVKGFYIFYEFNGTDWQPCYVGISQTIIRRLHQHLTYRNKSSASLAYLMAKHKAGRRLTQTEFDAKEYRPAFQEKIKKMKVRVVPYDGDSYQLQILEVLLAVKLKTYWNSFETH